MKITKKQIVSIFCLLFIFSPVLLNPLSISLVKADKTLTESQVGLEDIESVFGGDRGERDIRYMATDIISIVLGFLAVIFLGLTVFAGFKYMTAGGNEEKTREAMKLLKNAVIGLLICCALIYYGFRKMERK
jgi:amino acid transporter